MDDDVPDSAVDLVLKENVSVETGEVEDAVVKVYSVIIN